jgi:hypothetical protein
VQGPRLKTIPLRLIKKKYYPSMEMIEVFNGFITV